MPIAVPHLDSGPMRADFSGLWIPLVTPFKAAAVDHAALKRLVMHYQGSGIKGFVVCGSTGEAAALDDTEQAAVLDTVLANAAGLRVIMGISGYHLGKTCARVEALAGTGISGMLLAAPSYIRPSQAGLIEWFTSLASISPAPVLVYDIPARTGNVLQLETLLSLAALPNIYAVKDCSGDAAKVDAVIADGRLQVLAGDDADIFNTLTRGGSGAIAAAAHLQTRRFVEVMRHIHANEMVQAKACWELLLPLIATVFAEPNPGPVKALLARQGWLLNELRSPMTVATAALMERLDAFDEIAA